MASAACAFAAVPVTLTVSAAISLKQALEAAENDYKRLHPDVSFRNNFGASGALAQEIENGAPADLFFSAATREMDQLEAHHLLASGTRRNLLRNEIVLIAPASSTLAGYNGLRDNSIRFIALGEPGVVPAGDYAMATLHTLKLADALRSKFVYGHDVRQVLAFVETGNADAGFVYATDARQSLRVKVIAPAPANTHPPILYPVAVVGASTVQAAARAFEEYLATPQAAGTFARYGFAPAP